jgi:hypothetical protein
MTKQTPAPTVATPVPTDTVAPDTTAPTPVSTNATVPEPTPTPSTPGGTPETPETTSPEPTILPTLAATEPPQAAADVKTEIGFSLSLSQDVLSKMDDKAKAELVAPYTKAIKDACLKQFDVCDVTFEGFVVTTQAPSKRRLLADGVTAKYQIAVPSTATAQTKATGGKTEGVNLSNGGAIADITASLKTVVTSISSDADVVAAINAASNQVKALYVEAGGSADDFKGVVPTEVVTLKQPSITTAKGTVVIVKLKKEIEGLPASKTYDITVNIGGVLSIITKMSLLKRAYYDSAIAEAVGLALITNAGGTLDITTVAVTEITSSPNKVLIHALTATVNTAVYERRRTLADDTLAALDQKMTAALNGLNLILNANNGALLTAAKATYVAAGGSAADFTAKTTQVTIPTPVTLPPLSGSSIIANFSLVLATLATILIFAF